MIPSLQGILGLSANSRLFTRYRRVCRAQLRQCFDESVWRIEFPSSPYSAFPSLAYSLALSPSSFTRTHSDDRFPLSWHSSIDLEFLAASRSPTDLPNAQRRVGAATRLSLTAGNVLGAIRFIQSHGPSCASRIVAASVLPITLRWLSRSVTAVGSRCLASHKSRMCSVGLALVAK